ncbi:hypothetical protein J437_LFUL001833 [Ladona fulva]|uniref:Uncharacterized protein n=1 Tax=Ladona fulva TaxID=123851 RepID=A0A8K0NUD7_LADFU|nr:hypothetical protein J437_LFUL001833 [Ladona fulva]
MEDMNTAATSFPFASPSPTCCGRQETFFGPIFPGNPCGMQARCLEALAMDNGWARFVVLLLGDPHLLEGGERSQDGTSNPYRVLPLGWSDDLDLHGGWSQGSNFLLHTVGDSRVVSWIPQDSIPKKEGWNMASGHRNRSLPMCSSIGCKCTVQSTFAMEDKRLADAVIIDLQRVVNDSLSAIYLCHLLPVGLRVERCLRQQNRVFLRSHSKFIVEGVVPDLLHIIPVGNDSMLNWEAFHGLARLVGASVTHAKNWETIGRGESSSELTNLTCLIARAAHDGREDGPWGVVAGETSFAHSGSIVHDKCCNILVTHVDLVGFLVALRRRKLRER